jgi:hypothetical protein
MLAKAYPLESPSRVSQVIAQWLLYTEGRSRPM